MYLVCIQALRQHVICSCMAGKSTAAPEQSRVPEQSNSLQDEQVEPAGEEPASLP